MSDAEILDAIEQFREGAAVYAYYGMPEVSGAFAREADKLAAQLAAPTTTATR